ncbi:MAG TPA: hypothetical protein VMR34_03025 [Candidatus Saccharimonadales bacterium]|nr:hypothetical protein [Candidatus Saccharimonadales bacterium]
MYKHLLDPEFPETCPGRPTETTCGLVAANWLLGADFIAWDKKAQLHIDEWGAKVFEVLIANGDTSNDTSWLAFADFGCLACGKCVRIQEEPYSDESVSIATPIQRS